MTRQLKGGDGGDTSRKPSKASKESMRHRKRIQNHEQTTLQGSMTTNQTLQTLFEIRNKMVDEKVAIKMPKLHTSSYCEPICATSLVKVF